MALEGLAGNLNGSARSSECIACGVGLISKYEWDYKMGPRERQATRMRPHGGKQRCVKCYNTYYWCPEGRKTWKLADLIEEAEHLFSYGASADEVANRLNLKRNSLATAFKRGRDRGLTERRVSFRKVAA